MLQNTRRIGSTRNLLWFALDRIQQGTSKVYIVAANENHKQHIKKEIDKMGGLPDGIKVTTINEPILGNGESVEFIVDHYTYESEIVKLSGMVQKRDEYIHSLQESIEETKNTLKQYKELCDGVAKAKKKQDHEMMRLRKELSDRQSDIDEYDDEVVDLRAEIKKLRKELQETQAMSDNFLTSFQAAGEDFDRVKSENNILKDQLDLVKANARLDMEMAGGAFDRVKEENKKLKDELKKIEDADLKHKNDLMLSGICPKCGYRLITEMCVKDRQFWEHPSPFKPYVIGASCDNCGWSYGTMWKGNNNG